jgi:RHS repeat-associated protein
VGHAGHLISGFSYNALGEPVSDSLGNGDNESWSYSKDGVLTNYSVGSGPTYDFNLTVNTGVISASTNNQYAGMTYTYDDFNRLSTQGQTGTGGSGVAFGYDQYGNRWSEAPTKGSPPTSSFGFSVLPNTPPTNRILVSSGVAYDGAGNMTYDGRYYYTFDGNNRVTAVGTAPGGSQVASYAYNTRGWRYQTTVSGTTVDWLYSLYGERLTAEVPGTTQIYGNEYFVGGRDWGAANTNGVNFRYADWLGNGQVWKDVAGTVTQQEAYWGFGDGIFAPGGGSCCNFAFQFDDASADSNGTFHTPNREYEPSQGRWLTPDPGGLAVMDVSNPQTWNRYAYVTNNPVSYTDPWGLFRCGPSCGCNSDAYDCGSSGGSPSDPGAGGATDFSAIGNSSNECPICSGPYGSLGTAGFADGFFNVTNGGPGSGFGSPSGDLSSVIFNYTTTSEGYLVGDYAGELLCPTGWGCTVWNPNTQQWEEPTIFNCAGCAAMWRRAPGFVGGVAAGGVFAGAGGAALASLEWMQVAVGTVDGNLHFALGANGMWMHAVSDAAGGFFMTTARAASFAAGAFQFSLPVFDASTVLPEAGAAASNCFAAVCNGFLSGW